MSEQMKFKWLIPLILIVVGLSLRVATIVKHDTGWFRDVTYNQLKLNDEWSHWNYAMYVRNFQKLPDYFYPHRMTKDDKTQKSDFYESFQLPLYYIFLASSGIENQKVARFFNMLFAVGFWILCYMIYRSNWFLAFAMLSPAFSVIDVVIGNDQLMLLFVGLMGYFITKDRYVEATLMVIVSAFVKAQGIALLFAMTLFWIYRFYLGRNSSSMRMLILSSFSFLGSILVLLNRLPYENPAALNDITQATQMLSMMVANGMYEYFLPLFYPIGNNPEYIPVFSPLLAITLAPLVGILWYFIGKFLFRTFLHSNWKATFIGKFMVLCMLGVVFVWVYGGIFHIDAHLRYLFPAIPFLLIIASGKHNLAGVRI